MKKSVELSSFLLFVFSCIIFTLISVIFFLIGKFLISTDLPTIAHQTDVNFTVVLDAGHGGADGGASSNGVFEKDLNLEIVKKIEKFLSLYNVDVKLTRSEDVLLSESNSKHKKRDDLFNRLKFTRSFKEPIFISIHINKFPEEKYKGMQVFYSKNNSLSEALALVIQGSTKELLQPNNNRNVKSATSSIYLLDQLQCPAVLVECGFLSNEDDFRDLTTETYQDKLAFVIANSIIKFINI